MLRSIRLRIRSKPLLIHRLYRSGLAVEGGQTTDPYGSEYGAGPSRLPYDPVSEFAATPLSIRRLSKALKQLQPEIDYDAILSHLYPQGSVSFNSLPRLQRHIILNHLIRDRRKGTAALQLSLIHI